MRSMTLADAKAQLSAVVDSVEAGEEIVITRRGKPVARIVAEHAAPAYDSAALHEDIRAFVLAQRPQATSAVATVRSLRGKARY
jgi:prevent-host-death family protein